MEIMVTPDEGVAIFFHEAMEQDEFSLRIAVIGSDGDREQPELGLQVVAGDVDVGRFRALAGVEVEAVGADA